MERGFLITWKRIRNYYGSRNLTCCVRRKACQMSISQRWLYIQQENWETFWCSRCAYLPIFELGYLTFYYWTVRVVNFYSFSSYIRSVAHVCYFLYMVKGMGTVTFGKFLIITSLNITSAHSVHPIICSLGVLTLSHISYDLLYLPFLFNLCFSLDIFYWTIFEFISPIFFYLSNKFLIWGIFQL